MQGNENVKKEYLNNWLVDSAFIKKQEFSDTYYLESLCYHINSFLKNTPVPVVAKISNSFKDDNKIEFSVGAIRKQFKASVNYSYFDFIALVRQWLYKYYPQYSVEYDVEVPLSEDEMCALVKKGEYKNLNDIIDLRKIERVKEHCVIEKIMLKDDQFIMNKNGIRSIYISGTIKNPMSLSNFKKQLYVIKDDDQKKKFIEDNSTFVKELDETKDIIIDYQGQQMINFFKVNLDELCESAQTNISSFTWRFGRFVVKFSSQSLMDDCLRYIKNKE